MPIEISIVGSSSVPIYRQIVDQVCRAVANGQLLPAEQMPTVCVLAEDLVLNPNTVARAYADLVREGVLEAQKPRGVFVSRRRAVFTKAERLRRVDASLEAFLNEGIYLGFTAEELRESLERKLRTFEAANPRKGGTP